MVGGKVTISEAPKELADSSLRVLRLENPTYQIAIRKNPRARYALSEYINYGNYSERTQTLTLPSAMLERCIRWLDGKAIRYTIRDERTRVTAPLKSTIKLRDYQLGTLDVTDRHEQGIFHLSTGYGKGQPLDTPVLTPHGWVPIGSLRIGDRIIGSDGEAHGVTGIFPQGEQDIYHVSFTDGTSTLCDSNHLWAARTKKDKYLGIPFKVKGVTELRAGWQIPVVGPVNFSKKNLPIDPYVLGTLLGDGGLASSAIALHQPDMGVLQEANRRLLNTGYRLSEAMNVVMVRANITFNTLLNGLGLNGCRSYEKFIPKEYLFSSVEDRLLILRGLMDTDGTMNRSCSSAQFSSASEQLADDVAYLVRSLGGVARKSCKKKPMYTYKGDRLLGRPSYQVSVNLGTVSPFLAHSLRIERFSKRNVKYHPTKVIKSVEVVGRDQTVCIKVDAPDELYVTNDFIVTHNTLIALRLAEKLQQKTLIIVPKQDLLRQFKDEYEKYFPGKCGIIQGKKVKIEDVTVATVQSLKNRIRDNSLRPDTFGCLVIDECHLFVTKQSRAVLEYFNAFYRYGFTGTMGRSDGQIQAIEWIIGPVIMKKQIERAQPTIEIYEYPKKIFMDEYHNIIAEQVLHRERNQLIYDIAKEKRAEGRRVLILTKRVAHAEEIAQDTACYIFKASDAKGVRDEFLSAAKSCPDSISILMGTYALLGTGIDIPGLDTLILAGDLKSDVLLEQSAGRILRLFSDKASPVIIDIHDTGNPILRRQGKIRQEFYTSQDWLVQKIPFTTLENKLL